jgi:hypothetical protein
MGSYPQSGLLTSRFVVFNRFLEAEPNRMRWRPDSNGVLDLNVAVQQGGLVVLSGLE